MKERMKTRRGTERRRNQNRANMRKPTVILLVALAAAALILTLGDWLGGDGAVPAGAAGIGLRPGEAAVAVLNVGQADCIVIMDGDSVAVVDAGDRGSMEEIGAFLSAAGISEIDYLIATHPHADHIGSMRKIAESCKVRQILFSDVPEKLLPTSAAYLDLLQWIDESDTPFSIPGNGDVFDLGGGRLRVLSSGGMNDLNNCSLVLMYEYGETSFLLAGDAEQSAEEAILARGEDLSCDVLKAGHHGSDTSGSQEFLAAASPEYIAVSCGAGNSYGHPGEEFLSRAKASGTEIFRTDLDGTILLISNGTNITVKTDVKRAE